MEENTRRRVSRRGWIALVVALLGIYGVSQLSNPTPITTAPAPTATPVMARVEYRVTSQPPVNASLTYINATGGIEQISSYMLPWNQVIVVPPGTFTSISVQNTSNVTANVTCQITVDGAVVKQSTSSGAYVIASCSGAVER